MPRGRVRSGLADLIRRHGGLCFYCGSHVCKPRPGPLPKDPWHATKDHLNPRSLGGRGDRPNIVLACHECNQSKRNMTLVVFVLMAHLYRPEDR